jgi:4'-phosphopantetheinyl transferase
MSPEPPASTVPPGSTAPHGSTVPPGSTVQPGSTSPHGRTVPAGDVVDVWWFDTRTVTVGPAGLADLDHGERKRAEAFLFPADRRRYRVAHLMLRRVLADYTGTTPASLALGRDRCPRCGAAGKPVLLPASGRGARRAPSFSLAHSGDMVLIAVAGRQVGVDVEADAAGCVCSLALELHPADAARVVGLGEQERHEAIITCWVRAEAVLKATGQGIGHGLAGFPVGTGQATGLSVNGCTVREVAAPPGYRAAVALAGAGGVTPHTSVLRRQQRRDHDARHPLRHRDLT